MTFKFLPSRFNAASNTTGGIKAPVVKVYKPKVVKEEPYEMCRVVPIQLVNHQENFDWLYKPRYLDDFDEMLRQAIEDLIL